MLKHLKKTYLKQTVSLSAMPLCCLKHFSFHNFDTSGYHEVSKFSCFEIQEKTALGTVKVRIQHSQTLYFQSFTE